MVNEQFLKCRYKRAAALLWACLVMLLLTSCGKVSDLLPINSFAKDELFRINKLSCTRAEYMVYLATTQARYEEVYGSEVWQVAKGDESLEENVKQTVLSRIARVKTMCLLADSKGISLDEKEEEKAAAAAKRYMNQVQAQTAADMNLTEELLTQAYKEYALSEKVYNTIIQAVNPEISDDEARTVVVWNITFKTWTTDGRGERIDYSREMKAEVLAQAEEVLQEIRDGRDFKELASAYNEGGEIELSFGKGEVDTELERMAFALETDEVSPVIETDEGYQIIKCISTFDREQTEKRKTEILESRRKAAFNTEYDAFAENITAALNEELFDSIAPSHENRIEVPDFFGIYEDIF